MSQDSQDTSQTQGPEAWLPLVTRQVQALRFGTIQLTVHDGRVVQVDCTQRTRLAGSPATTAPRIHRK